MITKPKFKLAKGANSYGDVWEVNQAKGIKHPAPFPVELIEKIISSTNAQLVLDPFMGSGTTAIAANKLGRKYLGIEISPEYCEYAEDRIQTESKQAQIAL